MKRRKKNMARWFEICHENAWGKSFIEIPWLKFDKLDCDTNNNRKKGIGFWWKHKQKWKEGRSGFTSFLLSLFIGIRLDRRDLLPSPSARIHLLLLTQLKKSEGGLRLPVDRDRVNKKFFRSLFSTKERFPHSSPKIDSFSFEFVKEILLKAW